MTTVREIRTPAMGTALKKATKGLPAITVEEVQEYLAPICLKMVTTEARMRSAKKFFSELYQLESWADGYVTHMRHTGDASEVHIVSSSFPIKEEHGRDHERIILFCVADTARFVQDLREISRVLTVMKS